MTIVVERFLSLREARVAPRKLADEVVMITRSSLPTADVVNKLSNSSVLGQVLAQGIRAVVADPRLSESGLRLAFENAGRAAVHRIARYLNTLGTIATAAPLLGLLGTVVGMIEIFGSQGPTGGSNPAQLAQGISIALYNTAFGLIIAIPALMLYRYFRGKVDEYTLPFLLPGNTGNGVSCFPGKEFVFYYNSPRHTDRTTGSVIRSISHL